MPELPMHIRLGRHKTTPCRAVRQSGREFAQLPARSLAAINGNLPACSEGRRDDSRLRQNPADR